MKIKKGVTRIVFLVGKYAFKIPNFKYCQLHFIQGCYANLSERMYCRQMKPLKQFYELVSPSIFCSWLGLLQIQIRTREIPKDVHIDYSHYENVCQDKKPENFGILNNKVVCIDYP